MRWIILDSRQARMAGELGLETKVENGQTYVLGQDNFSLIRDAILKADEDAAKAERVAWRDKGHGKLMLDGAPKYLTPQDFLTLVEQVGATSEAERISYAIDHGLVYGQIQVVSYMRATAASLSWAGPTGFSHQTCVIEVSSHDGDQAGISQFVIPAWATEERLTAWYELYQDRFLVPIASTDWDV